mmetsp:Transcript_1209/g.1086  ORF Transcript_1209/g.1086 Transcript_1209/m.1086 type:complete len:157 (-) Transcript_1209:14-484(-)
MVSLGHQGGGRGGLVLPVGGQLLHALVVAGQAVDAGLNQNQPELAVLILPVAVQVLADGHCLLDHVVHVLRNLRCQALALQDTQDFGAGDGADLGHAALVPEQDADAGGRHTLACQLADLLNHLLGGGLAPAGRAALVGEGGGAEPLALAVHAPHV